jgi:FtsH-binding integral membrane protein
MHIPMVGILICMASLAIACAYILYDLNMIMGGKR